MPLCEWCMALSARYQALRECCQIRLLATMPQHARLAVYARTRAVGGREAERAQMALVKAEYARQHGARVAKHKAHIQSLKNLIGAKTV